MLTLTENAPILIKTLAGQAAETEKAGFRISTGTDKAPLSIDHTAFRILA